MGKEYFGCIYHRPPPVAQPPDVDAQRIARQVVPNLYDVPILIEHNRQHVAGRVTRAWQDPTDGSCFVAFNLRDTDHGRRAEHLIRSKQMVGLSMGHEFTPTNDVMPFEVSICTQGKRPNTFIYNASATAGGMNRVNYTTPVYPLFKQTMATPQGTFDSLSPELKAALSTAFRTLGANNQGLPATLQMFDPLAYEAQTQAAQQQQALSDQQRKQLAYQEAKKFAAAFEQEQAQAQQAQQQAQQPVPMEAEETKKQGTKRGALEAELEPLRRDNEEKQKQLKLMTDTLFEDLEKSIPASLENRDAVVTDLKNQVYSSPNPGAMIKTLKQLYKAAPAPVAAAPAAAATTPAKETVPPNVNATPLPVQNPALINALNQTQMQAQQQRYTHTPVPMSTGASTMEYKMDPTTPIAIPPLGFVHASAADYNPQTQLEQLLYSFLKTAEPYVGDVIRKHPSNPKLIYGRK